MKKILNILLFFIFTSCITVQAMTFEEEFALTNKSPMAVLLYADWANNYQTSLEQFRIVQKQLGKNFNFVELDVASSDMRAFNEKYQIYPQIPYILMFRDSGKIFRYIPRECTYSSSCINDKLKSFIQ